MKYSIQKLQTDVMARLGEIAAPLPPEGGDVPWPEDIIALKVRSLLSEVGTRLILEAPPDFIAAPPSGGWGALGSGASTMRLMHCGLYAAELRLPEGFLRLTSVKMTGWRLSAQSLILPASEEWGRQWSAEPGIAGCPERPRVYLDSDADGRLLRLVGSESEAESLEWLSGWCVPVADEEGEFDFPESLYGELVGTITEKLG